MAPSKVSPSFARRLVPSTVRHALVLAAAPLAATVWAGETCSAVSGPARRTVIELYTSEGCRSCPPADRWLSTQRQRPEVVAIAFHVTYWDQLGWRDRFASNAFAKRQADQLSINGARNRYTPQVVIDGDDRMDWPRAGMARPGDARRAVVDLSVRREGSQYVAVVKGTAGSPARLAGWWALTENGQTSAVKAGENAGETLRHDGIARVWQPVPEWSSAGPHELRWSPVAPADMGAAREVVFVVTDGASGKPVQALKLGC